LFNPFGSLIESGVLHPAGAVMVGLDTATLRTTSAAIHCSV
jgi:hypothetical protein